MIRPSLLVAALLTSPLAAQQALSPLDSALHALNRLAWGPRPGLADSIARTGVMAWIDAQLAPGRPADGELAARERAFPVLRASPEDLVRQLVELQRQAQAARRAARSSDSGQARNPNAARPGGDALRRSFRSLGPQLRQATLVRALQAEHQLGEVMADFWFNHFNIDQNKGLDRALLPAYVERTIRPRALGRYEDLLIATARSPAMLFYLDNVQSVKPGAVPPQLERLERMGRGRGMRARPGARPRLDSLMQQIERRRPRGLNENYARELLELHTLGVDGGYLQADVTEVARILTGWGIRAPRDGARFEYHDWAHDRGAKTVLGEKFPAGQGEDEGLRLLRSLADHPSTRHHIGAKLCARLVADTPPDGCIDAAVAAWRRSDGDIGEILRAIVRSDDFWAAAAMESKVKTPLEFVVSAVRATGGVADSTPRLALQLARLGQPLFQHSAPTGYPEAQEDWVNSGALLARMNFAMALASGRLPGVTVELDRVIPVSHDREALVDAVDQVILNGRMTPSTRAVILKELAEVADPVLARVLAVGLAIGGPEFQRQ